MAQQGQGQNQAGLGLGQWFAKAARAVKAGRGFAGRIISGSSSPREIIGGNSGYFTGLTNLNNLPLTRFLNDVDRIDAYRTIPSVYTCVNAIANSVAKLPLEFHDEDSKLVGTLQTEKAAPDSFAAILKNPNDQMTYYDLIVTLLMHLELAGNGIFFLENIDGMGRPTGIYPLNPTRIRMYVTPEKGIVGYSYLPDGANYGGNMMYFDVREILHFRYPSPVSLIWGQGTLEALASSLDLDVNLTDLSRAFFRNGAIIPGAFTVQDSLSEDEFKRLKEQFNEDHSGSQNFFKPLLLERGATWQSMSVPLKELGAAELDKRVEEKIYKAFGVPQSQVGEQGRANVKNDYLGEVFWQTTIAPKVQCILPKLEILAKRFDGRVTLAMPVPETIDTSGVVAVAAQIDGLTIFSTKEKRIMAKSLLSQAIPAVSDFPDEPDPAQMAAPVGATPDAENQALPSGTEPGGDAGTGGMPANVIDMENPPDFSPETTGDTDELPEAA